MKHDIKVNISFLISSLLIISGITLFSWKIGLIAKGIILFLVTFIYGEEIK